jgi:hypothetical protein
LPSLSRSSTRLRRPRSWSGDNENNGEIADRQNRNNAGGGKRIWASREKELFLNGR